MKFTGPYHKPRLHNSQVGGKHAQFGKEQHNYITIHFNMSEQEPNHQPNTTSALTRHCQNLGKLIKNSSKWKPVVRMMGFLEKIFNAALKLMKEKLNKNINRHMIDEVFMLNHICKSRKRHAKNFKTQMLVEKTRSLAKNDITLSNSTPINKKKKTTNHQQNFGKFINN